MLVVACCGYVPASPRATRKSEEVGFQVRLAEGPSYPLYKPGEWVRLVELAQGVARCLAKQD